MEQKSSSMTTDHETIRRWAEERQGHPAKVKGTGGKDDIGVIRLDFPGFTGKDSLDEISWDDFFSEFEKRELALLYQDKTAKGEQSRFNKLVNRRSQPRKRQ